MAKKEVAVKEVKEKKVSTVENSFDFFSGVKTGDRWADAGKDRGITEWIDTGSFSLNALISGDMDKGFPGNRIVMLAGEQAVGKTFFAIYGFCRPLVNMGYHIYYIDTENAVDNEMLMGYGLPKGSFKIIQEDIVEELKTKFDKILTQIEEAMGSAMTNKHKCAFVLDSQGMLDTIKSRQDIAKANYVSDMTAQKQMKSFYKSIMIRLGALGIPMLVTNHVYANIGGYGDPTKIAGGSGGLYASTVILHLRKKKMQEGTGENKVHKGTIITAKNVKSRITRDGLESGVYLNFEKGLNKWYGVHNYADDAGLIVKYEEANHTKLGVPVPVKKGNKKPTYWLIKDPKIPPSQWIVCDEGDLFKASTIGTIFNEVNEYVKGSFKLTKPLDFNFDDDTTEEGETLDIELDKLVDADTVVSIAQKRGMMTLIETDE